MVHGTYKNTNNNKIWVFVFCLHIPNIHIAQIVCLCGKPNERAQNIFRFSVSRSARCRVCCVHLTFEFIWTFFFFKNIILHYTPQDMMWRCEECWCAVGCLLFQWVHTRCFLSNAICLFFFTSLFNEHERWENNWPDLFVHPSEWCTKSQPVSFPLNLIRSITEYIESTYGQISNMRLQHSTDLLMPVSPSNVIRPFKFRSCPNQQHNSLATSIGNVTILPQHSYTQQQTIYAYALCIWWIWKTKNPQQTLQNGCCICISVARLKTVALHHLLCFICAYCICVTHNSH